MRLKAPITVSALVLAGLVSAGSSASTYVGGPDPRTPAPLLSAAAHEQISAVKLANTVGLVPSSPRPARKLHQVSPTLPASFAGAMPLRDVSIPSAIGALGIPEIALAAYRNAELALAASEPNCGVSWNLLAAIGRIESGHAGGGKTDAVGTTTTRVLGPTLDGTLAGNNVITDTDGGALDGDNLHDRAIGPMQFIPSTWKNYASDANGDGVADPNNIFDAALSAGKYLCSGGLNLREPAQELQSVLRYNNSMAYAANVLSWSAAYRTGAIPSPVSISADLVPPGTSPIDVSALVAESAAATTTTTTTDTTSPSTTTTTSPPMITIPGIGEFPCGILCPAPPPPAVVQPTTPTTPATPGAPGQQLVEAPPAAPNAQAPATPNSPDPFMRPAPTQEAAPAAPAAPTQPPVAPGPASAPVPAPEPLFQLPPLQLPFELPPLPTFPLAMPLP